MIPQIYMLQGSKPKYLLLTKCVMWIFPNNRKPNLNPWSFFMFYTFTFNSPNVFSISEILSTSTQDVYNLYYISKSCRFYSLMAFWMLLFSRYACWSKYTILWMVAIFSTLAFSCPIFLYSDSFSKMQLWKYDDNVFLIRIVFILSK